MKPRQTAVLSFLVLLMGITQTACQAETRKSTDPTGNINLKTTADTSVNSTVLPPEWEDDLRQQWDVFYQEMQKMRTEMEKSMGTVFPGYRGDQRNMTLTRSLEIKTDIAESPSEYLVTMDLPGIDKENLGVEVKDGLLTVSGKREAHNAKTEEGKDYEYQYRERSSGSFQRTLRIPDNVDAAKVAAKYDNGILKIHLPKLSKTESKPIQVQVQ